MFIGWIPDEIFLKIRKELQKNERTIDLIYGETRNKPVSISDIINIHQGNSETTDHSNILDRIRSLMDLNRYNSTWTSEPYELPLVPRNDLTSQGEYEVTRRINDYPINIDVNINDYLTYFTGSTRNY
jgi:hypothetical protein